MPHKDLESLKRVLAAPSKVLKAASGESGPVAKPPSGMGAGSKGAYDYWRKNRPDITDAAGKAPVKKAIGKVPPGKRP